MTKDGDQTSERPESAHVSDEEEAAPATSCEMCANYEENLAKLQESERELKEQVAAARELSDRYEKELSGERLYRKELEGNLAALGIDTEKQVKGAAEANKELEGQFETIIVRQESAMESLRNELDGLKRQYSALQADMLAINQRYQQLLGVNRQKAAEMREQSIELPQSVDQLQFLCLQLREELIETRSAYEHSVVELKDELAAVRENLSEEHYHAIQRQTEEEMEMELEQYKEKYDQLETRFKTLQTERASMDDSMQKYRQKCTTLQTNLDTMETVQKDFVRLSQNLQIQLEKIRQAEQEVRWQFEDDVSKCGNCETDFSMRRPKTHCMHCGKIFCRDCLSHTIPSGPNHRPAKVCDVCHTLLNRDSAPFFSRGATGDAQ